jgi:hypothetical protein
VEAVSDPLLGALLILFGLALHRRASRVLAFEPRLKDEGVASDIDHTCRSRRLGMLLTRQVREIMMPMASCSCPSGQVGELACLERGARPPNWGVSQAASP